MRHRCLGALALAAVLAPASLDSSGPSPRQAPERTLVIDFYALGPDGAGLADLRQDEVVVRINGRARTVRSLRMVRQATPPPADPLALAAQLPDPFTTNRVAEAGRTFIVVVDDESFRPGRERPIRSALRAFLGALSPRDRVSLWTMPHGGIKVNLTTNHDRIQSEMELVSGHGPDRESGSEGACRTRATLQATEHMLSLLTGGEGPTTVIFFTGGLYGPRRDAPVNRAPGACELRSDEFQRIGSAAAQARAHFYIVQPEDLQRLPTNRADTLAGEGFAPTMNPLEGIEHLAAVTGGRRMSLSRAGDATLLAVARATATYYSAVVDGAASDQPGAHGLEVRVTRAGADVRSQPFVHVGRSTGLIPKALTPPEMVKVGASFSDLPLRVSGFASLNDRSGGMRLIAAAEPAEPGVTLASASVAYFDTQGKMVGLTNVTPAQTGIPVLAAVVVPAGTYRVRVAAVDAAGRGGAADTEVDAVMTPAGSLRLSSLVLGLWRQDAFQPRLQFSTEPVAIAYLDIVGGTAGVAVTAFVEVSQTLNGPPIVTTRLTLEATSDPSRFSASAAVPIGGLPPGDYVVRAIVGVQGQAAGRVVRTLRKTN